MAAISVTQRFAAAPPRVFDYLAEHENLGPLLNAKITRVKDGDTSRDGVGSVRRLKIGPLPAFEETVTEVQPEQLIRYRISKGSPLRDHVGLLTFTPTGAGGCDVRWDITFRAAPGLEQLVAAGLKATLTRGLAKAARQLS